MESQEQVVKEVIENIPDGSVGKDRFNFSIKIVVILVIIILSIVIGFVLLKVNKNQHLVNKANVVIISPQPSQIAKLGNKYETNKTKIAESLDISLDSSNQWRDVTKDSGDIDLNTAWVYDDMIKVPFKKGRFWKSDSPAPMFSLEGYYSDKLEKMGWIGPSLSIRPLEFKSFKLSGLSADSPCGGALGFLGYKDGFVRMVTLQYKLEPCQPLAMAEISPLPTDTVYSSYYMIFISEPTPIEEIAQYISNTSDSGS